MRSPFCCSELFSCCILLFAATRASPVVNRKGIRAGSQDFELKKHDTPSNFPNANSQSKSHPSALFLHRLTLLLVRICRQRLGHSRCSLRYWRILRRPPNNLGQPARNTQALFLARPCLDCVLPSSADISFAYRFFPPTDPAAGYHDSERSLYFSPLTLTRAYNHHSGTHIPRSISQICCGWSSR